MKKRSIETELVQLGNKSDEKTGAVNPPLYLSTAYQHQGLGQSTGYDYTRTKNPTRSLLEEGIANLESGDHGYACSSGMAAIQLVFSLFRAGDELLVLDDVYGGTYRLLQHYAEAYDIKTTYTNLKDDTETKQRISQKTKGIFIETPTNPLMQEMDIAHIAKVAQQFNLLFIVDNTFYTPLLQRPLELGADIVIHSATKYIGGHNDVLAGLVIAKGKDLCEKLANFHNASGAVLSPFDSWLLIRGLKTLALRIEKQESNAKAMVSFLEEHPMINDVLYPGKGGMLSFRLHNSAWVDHFLQQLQLIIFAESLGGVESFITYPATQTHADIPKEERIKRGIDDRLLRFSVGIEQADELIEDLQQALYAVQAYA
ncbi:methionine biosynthesis PLP-dependent protein [Virgibacillus salexigens]|uniref:Cystathionine gamma-synthase n=1 Tax=Virgibacillus kapii TaxID=1638645 RepID=A0ABQ2DVV9_9BACI|nr:methionine biosynthesis PLP-dependent protein [Virgibacillus kapii]GGJ74259.1 cystathionine gamma-synthase [Virgibacillus kapii]